MSLRTLDRGPSRVCGLALAGLVGATTSIGCRNPRPEGEAIVRPADSSSAVGAAASSGGPSPSASAAGGPSAVAAGAQAAGTCHDGTYDEPKIPDGMFGSGGLGLTGVGEPSGPVGDATPSLGLGGIDTTLHGAGPGLGPSIGGGFGRLHGLTGTLGAVTGSVAPAVAARALCDAMLVLKPCFRALPVPSAGLTGQVQLALHVDGSGRVHPAEVRSSTFASTALKACLGAAAETLVLPPLATGGGDLDYQLEYGRHPSGAPTLAMREVGVEIVGELPPEVVRRGARTHFPRLRACYEHALKTEPTLHGVVAIRFGIDATGSVSTAAVAPTTAPDPLTDGPMSSCVLGVFRTLSFPEPKSGTVSVLYPIRFEVDDE